MTSIAIAADAWTSIYSAESNVTIGLQNVSEHDNMLVRIDATAATSDDATAPADILAPHEGVRTCPASLRSLPICARHNRHRVR
jgi:hypothetical protein